jgi:hypothetical protein
MCVTRAEGDELSVTVIRRPDLYRASRGGPRDVRNRKAQWAAIAASRRVSGTGSRELDPCETQLRRLKHLGSRLTWY